jgi:hypothetical protein
MTPAAIIQEAQAGGVRLALSPAGTIKVTGDGTAVNHWLAMIREHKAEIIDVLKVDAGNMAPGSRWWVLHYPDRDPVEVSCTPAATHAEILERHPDAIAAEPVIPTTRQSLAPMSSDEEAAELPKPNPFPDDRRTCEQCANLLGNRCQAAKRGGIVASRNYEPIRDLPRRCEGYVPVATCGITVALSSI